MEQSKLSEITGWELKLVPMHAWVRIGENEQATGIGINLETYPGLAGLKTAPYVNLSRKTDADSRHFYESTEKEYVRPFIALRLVEDAFKDIERHILSPMLSRIDMTIEIRTREFSGSKMFFAAEIEFHFHSSVR